MALFLSLFSAGGAGKARFNVATPTYEARTRPLHVQHTYYRIIFKQNPFHNISRGVQRRLGASVFPSIHATLDRLY